MPPLGVPNLDHYSATRRAGSPPRETRGPWTNSDKAASAIGDSPSWNNEFHLQAHGTDGLRTCSQVNAVGNRRRVPDESSDCVLVTLESGSQQSGPMGVVHSQPRQTIREADAMTVKTWMIAVAAVVTAVCSSGPLAPRAHAMPVAGAVQIGGAAHTAADPGLIRVHGWRHHRRVRGPHCFRAWTRGRGWHRHRSWCRRHYRPRHHWRRWHGRWHRGCVYRHGRLYCRF